ncbi:MAG: DEAD/DEAH box helicase [Bacteroidetes bacterium]|nr:DEAD/DEAH box helicase [Bacteroidota bacterium]
MSTFQELNLSKFILRSLEDLGFTTPTPIQQESFSVISSGRDIIGLAQTGTGKTLAYGLPILNQLKYGVQIPPRVLILVPTRELVVQVVEMLQNASSHQNLRIMGIYGGANINVQRKKIGEGTDILVATPGRLYDLCVDGALTLNAVKQLVIDEVDVMLDLGFRFQLTNLFEILPTKKQNILFSATMTDEVEILINDFFNAPQKISIALSGEPLKNIAQSAYPVKNFYTKFNLLKHLLSQQEDMNKVLVFTASKKMADRLHNCFLEEAWGNRISVTHSNKSQNHRFAALEDFESGNVQALITTDVMARGIDIESVSHVVNLDVPRFPENYIHRIGRTGRANKIGNSITFYTENEFEFVQGIEELMQMEINKIEFPAEVEISKELTPDEVQKTNEGQSNHQLKNAEPSGPAFHEKIAKNKKVNLGGSYKQTIKTKFKKPRTKGDKIGNRKRK